MGEVKGYNLTDLSEIIVLAARRQVDKPLSLEQKRLGEIEYGVEDVLLVGDEVGLSEANLLWAIEEHSAIEFPGYEGPDLFAISKIYWDSFDRKLDGSKYGSKYHDNKATFIGECSTPCRGLNSRYRFLKDERTFVNAKFRVSFKDRKSGPVRVKFSIEQPEIYDDLVEAIEETTMKLRKYVQPFKNKDLYTANFSVNNYSKLRKELDE